MKNYKAYIFDLDGTLVDTMGFYLQAWQEAMGEAGYKISAQEVYAREGERADVTAIEVIKQQSGELITHQKALQIIKKRDEVFAKIYTHRLMPGAMELLDSLNVKGFKLGLVTGSHNVKQRFIDLPGFLSYFDIITSGNDTQQGKPFPDPYLHAVLHLQELADDCLAIENAPFGIRSAVSAGLRCVALRGTSPLSSSVLFEAGAREVFDTLPELKASLDR